VLAEKEKVRQKEATGGDTNTGSYGEDEGPNLFTENVAKGVFRLKVAPRSNMWEGLKI